MSRRADGWVRWVTVGAVVLVGLVAGVISYFHMLELGEQSGEAWRAYLLPLSVDGMLVASTLAVVVRRRACLPVGWVPWFGLVAGILASLAANVAAAEPTLTARVVAGWPPVALAISIEVLVIVSRTASATAEAPTEAMPAPTELPTTDRETSPALPPAPKRVTTRARKRAPKRAVERVTELAESGMGRRAISKETGLTEHQVRSLLTRDGDQPLALTNGHGPS